MGTLSGIGLDIGAFNNKEASAYNYAFKAYYPALCDFAGRLVGADKAEDIVEDLFLKVWAARQLFNDPEHLKAFCSIPLKTPHLTLSRKQKERVIDTCCLRNGRKKMKPIIWRILSGQKYSYPCTKPLQPCRQPKGRS